jgi:hypothetical protein
MTEWSDRATRIEVSGGAGPYEAAAAVAAVLQVMADQAAAASVPPRRLQPPAWVTAHLPQPLPAPNRPWGSPAGTDRRLSDERDLPPSPPAI